MKREKMKAKAYSLVMIFAMLVICAFYSMNLTRPCINSADIVEMQKISGSSSENLPSSASENKAILKSDNNSSDDSSQISSSGIFKDNIVSSQPEEIQNRKYYGVPLSYSLQDIIFSECASKNVSSDLVIALIDVESNFNPKLISKTNDYGLMQINACHKDLLRKNLQITNLLDEKQNIKAGVYMLSGIVNKYSNINQELMVYNCGESGAKKLWNNGVYSTNYSRKVIAKINQIKS